MKKSFYSFVGQEEEKQKIGVYQITGVLQILADKIIKKGRNIQTNQEVAIKKLPKSYDKYSAREAEISSYIQNHKLQNAHIVQIYEILHIDSDTYLIMELCELDLEEYIKNKHQQQSQQSEDDMIIEAIEILKQIVKGYEYLSKQFDRKFMHRDIKPKNVLYKDGIFKLCDFELARFHNLNNPTKEVGTTHFKAPELQINTNITYDNKCDVYSLGVMLYWMVYKDYQLDLKKIQYPGLKRLIRDMIAQEPDQRISFQDLINDSFFTQDPRLSLNCQYLMYDHRKLSEILPVSNSTLETYFEINEQYILNMNSLFTSIMKSLDNNYHLRLIFAIWIKAINKIQISKNSQELAKIKNQIQIQQILYIKQSQDQNVNVEFLNLEELIEQVKQQISSKLLDKNLKKEFLQFLQQL